MKKLFLVAYRGNLVGIFSNRKKVWETVIELYDTTLDELKSRQRTIIGEYMVEGDGDWRLPTKSKTRTTRSIASLGTLTGLLLKTKNLYIRDIKTPNEKVTIQERGLNEVDIPKANPDYEN